MPAPRGRDVRNTDWQMSPDRDFTKQRFHRADFRNGSIGKRAQIILYSGKILRQVWIPHSDDHCFLGSLVQHPLQQNFTRVRKADRICGVGDPPRHRHFVNRRNHAFAHWSRL